MNSDIDYATYTYSALLAEQFTIEDDMIDLAEIMCEKTQALFTARLEAVKAMIATKQAHTMVAF